jgi:hypothetical protein
MMLRTLNRGHKLGFREKGAANQHVNILMLRVQGSV